MALASRSNSRAIAGVSFRRESLQFLQANAAPKIACLTGGGQQCSVLVKLVQRREVIEDPVSATLRRRNQVFLFDRQVGEDWVVVNGETHFPVALTAVEHGFEVTYEDSIFR